MAEMAPTESGKRPPRGSKGSLVSFASDVDGGMKAAKSQGSGRASTSSGSNMLGRTSVKKVSERRDSLHQDLMSMKEDLDLSPGEIDKVLLKLEYGVNQLLAAGDSTVKRGKAEMNLATNCDKMRDLFSEIVKVKDERKLFRECFADCKRVVKTGILLEQVEFKTTKDDRRTGVLQKARDVEDVLGDLGFAKVLEATKQTMKEKGIEGQREDDGTVQGPQAEALPELAKALVVGSVAVELEDQGKIAEAIVEYQKAKDSLGAAIKVIEAVVKFKASIGAKAKAEGDGEKLTVYQEQIQQRIEYLEQVPEGQVPEKKPEEQIHPPRLEMLQQPTWVSRLLVYAGTASIGFGAAVLTGPFLGMLLAGIAGAGAMTVVNSKAAAEQARAAQPPFQPSAAPMEVQRDAAGAGGVQGENRNLMLLTIGGVVVVAIVGACIYALFFNDSSTQFLRGMVE